MTRLIHFILNHSFKIMNDFILFINIPFFLYIYLHDLTPIRITANNTYLYTQLYNLLCEWYIIHINDILFYSHVINHLENIDIKNVSNNCGIIWDSYEGDGLKLFVILEIIY